MHRKVLIQVPQINRGGIIRSPYLYLIGVVFFCLIAIGKSYSAEDESVLLQQYREKLNISLDILESSEEPAALSKETLSKFREIFPYHQTVIVDGQKIHVKNVSFLGLLNELKGAKDKGEFSEKAEELRKKISLLLKETEAAYQDFVTDPKVKISGILSRKEFTRQELNPLLQKLHDWLGEKFEKLAKSIKGLFSGVAEKLRSFLERIFGFLPQRTIEKPADVLYQSFTVFLYVMGASLAIIFLIFFIRNKRYLYFFKKGRVSKSDITQTKQAEGLQQWQAVANRAEHALRNGNVKLAFHYLYLSLLLFLDEKRILVYNESFTNWEYSRQIVKFPALLQNFKSLTNRFEQVWYGQKYCDVNDYNDFVSGYNQIISSQ